MLDIILFLAFAAHQRLVDLLVVAMEELLEAEQQEAGLALLDQVVQRVYVLGQAN